MSKSIRVLCMMLAVITALFGCSVAPEETASTVDVKAVEEAVRASQEQIMDSAVILSNLAQYENNYWKALDSVGGDIRHDEMVSKAFEWLMDEAQISQEDVALTYATLSEQYADIANSGAGSEAVTQYKLLYQAYDRLYRVATTPSGNRNQFVEDYNEILDQLESADSLLTALVG